MTLKCIPTLWLRFIFLYNCDSFVSSESAKGGYWVYLLMSFWHWVFFSAFTILHRRPTTTEEILTIEVKPGWKKGTKITFPEKGNEQRNVIPSDLVFIIDEKPHSLFKRDGNDLIITQKIPLVEALTGYTVQLTTLDGRSLTVPINSVINPTYEEVVKGEGMPIPKEPSRRGNLRIKFNIKFPSKLTTEQKTGLKRLISWRERY